MRRTEKCGIAMILVATMFAMGLWACAPQVRAPARQPIFQKAEELSKLPARVPKPAKKTGTIAAVDKGTPAPFAGILLTEERAKKAAKLRISYDELYDIATINRRFTGVALRAADAQLAAADKQIAQLRKEANSWWNKNKVIMGLIIGSVLALSLSGLSVWGAGQLSK